MSLHAKDAILNHVRDGFGEDGGVKLRRVDLGLIGRSGEDIKPSPTINEDIASYIPMIVDLVEAGKLVPNPYEMVGEGFDSIIQAVEKLTKGGGSSAKLIVKVQSA